MGITHAFVSTKEDGDDETLVRPTDWNQEHTITDLIPSYEALCTADVTLTNASQWYDVTGCSLTLEAGTYVVFFTIAWVVNGLVSLFAKVYNGSSTVYELLDTSGQTNGFTYQASGHRLIVLGAETTVKLASLRSVDAGATVQHDPGSYGVDTSTKLTAIKIG